MDLLVLDLDLPDGSALGVVQEIRQGRLGRNPFLPIILLTWARQPKVLQRAVSSGIDLILVKPVSPAQLFSRIDGLVAQRRPFIVTADYVGPDRRGHAMSGDAQRYEVPNTLKEKLEGRQADPAALADKIDTVLQEVNASRVSQAGAKLAGALDEAIRAIEADEITDELEDALDALCRMARDIARIGDAEIRDTCKALLKILHTMRADIDEIQPEQADPLRPLANAILFAANRARSLHPVVEEIDRTLSAVATDAAPEPRRGAARRSR